MTVRSGLSGRASSVGKGRLTMASITETAETFFVACETGKGWQGCQAYCRPNATFSAQAGALAEIETLEHYTEWMKGLFTPLPDGAYDLKAFATDEERRVVTAYAVFSGSHTGEGGPVPPTGKTRAVGLRLCHGVRRRQDRHMTKIWNDGFALNGLGLGLGQGGPDDPMSRRFWRSCGVRAQADVPGWPSTATSPSRRRTGICRRQSSPLRQRHLSTGDRPYRSRRSTNTTTPGIPSRRSG